MWVGILRHEHHLIISPSDCTSTSKPQYLLGYIDALPSPAAPGRKANGVNGVNNKRSSSYGVIPSTASQHQQPEADRQKHAGGSYAKSATPKFKAEELKQLLTEAKEGLVSVWVRAQSVNPLREGAELFVGHRCKALPPQAMRHPRPVLSDV